MALIHESLCSSKSILESRLSSHLQIDKGCAMDNGWRWWVCCCCFLTENDEVEQAVLSKKYLNCPLLVWWDCSVRCYLFAWGIYLKAAHPVTLRFSRTECVITLICCAIWDILVAGNKHEQLDSIYGDYKELTVPDSVVCVRDAQKCTNIIQLFKQSGLSGGHNITLALCNYFTVLPPSREYSQQGEKKRVANWWNVILQRFAYFFKLSLVVSLKSKLYFEGRVTVL